MFTKSTRLENLSYAIRGPIFDKAQELQMAGHHIIQLNIGNPAPFGLDAPEEIIQDIILNLRKAQGYTHHLGIFPARKAIMQHCQEIGLMDVHIEDILIGNGVSELIVMTMQALLNNNDEVLIPTPDYPLWTTAVALSGGRPVHYICDEKSEWNPDIKDIRKKINSKTKAIVVINPNNPTGAVYPRETLEQIIQIAEEYNLIVYSDEIYDRVLYDGNQHIPIATLSDDVFFMTFGGLSKNYRSTGFRGGWVIASGAKHLAKSYLEGLNLLASMRLCANVPVQYGIQTALGGYQSIDDLVGPRGRLYKQMHYSYDRLTAIDGVTCVKPKGAMYLFPKVDFSLFDIQNDEDFIYKLLVEKKVLMVSGQGFNYTDDQHFRLVYLAGMETLTVAADRIVSFLEEHRK